jgi:hypothetical protein
MKTMKRKIIGMLVCMLLLATIPLAAGINDDRDIKQELQQPKTGKRTFVSGVIAFYRVSGGGNYITLFAISVRHGQIGGEYGIYRLQPVRFPNSFHGIMVTPFILGWFDGSPGWLQ